MNQWALFAAAVLGSSVLGAIVSQVFGRNLNKEQTAKLVRETYGEMNEDLRLELDRVNRERAYDIKRIRSLEVDVQLLKEQVRSLGAEPIVNNYFRKEKGNE